MHYSADTFPLYEGLFKEAHAALLKEGGLRSFIGRLADPKVYRRAEGLAERVHQAEGIVDPLAEKLTGANFENATNLRHIERLAKEVQSLGARPGALTEAQQAAQSATRGRNAALGVGALGVGAGVPAAYMAGESRGSADKTRTRNLAFGAGTAAGLAAPQLIRGLGNIARGTNQAGVFPELDGLGTGGYY